MYRFKRFTEKANVALNMAIEGAKECGHTYVGTEHIVLGLLREGTGVAAVALNAKGITAGRFGEKLLSMEQRGAYSMLTPEDFTPRAKAVLEAALTDAALSQQRLAGTEHILGAVLRDETGVAVRMIQSMEGRGNDILASLAKELSRIRARGAEWNGDYGLGAKAMPKSQRQPTLEQFGRDLTHLAQAGQLDPVLGRDEEITRTIRTLCRRRKNNPCLIGEPGVGKTAVVEGLAQRLAEDRVPDMLKGKRLISLDITGMVAGTKYRGDFEERVRSAIGEAQRAGDVLLFVDEMHNLMGTGAAEGAVDAANIFKPLLARGECRLIGATTVAEYRRHIEKDPALERRFQPITVEEPGEETTLTILRGLRTRYEAHHGVAITDEALESAVKLSEQYLPQRFLPDKAIDLVDEAAAFVHLQGDGEECREMPIHRYSSSPIDYACTKEEPWKNSAVATREKQKTVTAKDVAAVVSRWTGIPAQQVETGEAQRLRDLEDTLHRRLVGQNEAVGSLARAVKRNRLGLKNPKRPIGTFLLVGPTGVGKTELCKALAEALFGDEKALIRLDMSEYAEKHTASRLVGAPPGYVGYEEGGQLTEQVRRHPYSIVLLDEIEKAHPDIFNLLLQIMEDGRLTDGQGRVADFRHTVILMTSNVGAKTVFSQQKMGFSSAENENKDKNRRGEIMGELKKIFRPEFLNRLDEVLVFEPLTREEREKIALKLLTQLTERLQALGHTCTVEPEAVSLLAQAGSDVQNGARPMRRELCRLVEDPLADLLLARPQGEPAEITVYEKNGAISIGVKEKAEPC